MSDPLRPGELNCRITLSYMETERGELGETLPAREVSAGKAWSKKELVSGIIYVKIRSIISRLLGHLSARQTLTH